MAAWFRPPHHEFRCCLPRKTPAGRPDRFRFGCVAMSLCQDGKPAMFGPSLSSVSTGARQHHSGDHPAMGRHNCTVTQCVTYTVQCGPLSWSRRNLACTEGRPARVNRAREVGHDSCGQKSAKSLCWGGHSQGPFKSRPALPFLGIGGAVHGGWGADGG